MHAPAEHNPIKGNLPDNVIRPRVSHLHKMLFNYPEGDQREDEDVNSEVMRRVGKLCPSCHAPISYNNLIPRALYMKNSNSTLCHCIPTESYDVMCLRVSV